MTKMAILPMLAIYKKLECEDDPNIVFYFGGVFFETLTHNSTHKTSINVNLHLC